MIEPPARPATPLTDLGPGQGDGPAHTVTIDTGVDIYFCDPHCPWQRGSNENTNGLLRQYFPRTVNLRQFTPEDLANVAHKLNTRPRETLDWKTPAQRLAELLNQTVPPDPVR